VDCFSYIAHIVHIFQIYVFHDSLAYSLLVRALLDGPAPAGVCDAVF